MRKHSLTRRSKLGLFVPGPKVYDYLLKFPCVVDWINGYESRYTKDQFLRTLHLFIEQSSVGPDELLGMGADEIRLRLVRVSREIRDQGKHAWALALIKSVKSFCRYHGIELKLRRGERIRARRKRIGKEIIPNCDQVYRMVDHARTLRDKAVILCMWQSGVRVGCLVNWRFGMVRDQLFQPDGKMRVPVRLKITEELDTKLRNYDIGYSYTFLAREAAEALKQYLQWRIDRGESLTDEDSIFVTDSTTVKGNPLKPASIREMIKYCAKKAGLKPDGLWPHCLRKAFRKVLNNTDIDEDTKESLMGHKLPVSRGSYFDYHDVDEVERKYTRIDFSPQRAASIEELRKRQVLDMVRVLGISDEKIKKVEEALAKYEHVDKALEEIKKLSLGSYKKTDKGNNETNCDGEGNCGKHEIRIVRDEQRLIRFLSEGWDLVRELSNHRFVLKKSF